MPTLKVPNGKELIDARFLLEKAGIAENMKIADLGCGQSGYFALQAGKLIGQNGTIYAVDILKAALRSVESSAKLFGINNLKTIWADLETLGSTKIQKATIDLAMLNNILFQTQKPEITMQETARILKENGKLLVVDWRKIAVPFGPPVQDRIDPTEIKQMAKKAGLTFKMEFDAGPYHYALIFKK